MYLGSPQAISPSIGSLWVVMGKILEILKVLSEFSSHPIKYAGLQSSASAYRLTFLFDNSLEVSTLLTDERDLYPNFFASSSCVNPSSSLRLLILSPIFISSPSFVDFDKPIITLVESIFNIF